MARLSTLTPLCYSGSIMEPTVGDIVWDPHRSSLIVVAIGTTLEEALASIGMLTSESVTHLEYDADAGLPNDMHDVYPTQPFNHWAEAGVNENLPTAVDWMIAIYQGMLKDWDGSGTAIVRNWRMI